MDRRRYFPKNPMWCPLWKSWRIQPSCCLYLFGKISASHKSMLSKYTTNNSRLLQQLRSYPTSNNLQANQIPNPASTITNDYDLANKIHQTIQHILLPVKLQHVKGHQNQNTLVKNLPYKAQLNIACNKRACNNPKTLPMNTQPNPTLPHAYPHLHIYNQTIVHKLANYMWEYSRLPVYKQYLLNKFQWNLSLTDNIEWQTVDYAMQRFNSQDRIWIQKIIHEWIPTQVSPEITPA